MANFRLGYLEHARAALQEATDLQRETGERFWEATSLNSLGWIAYLQADYAAARTFLLDSLDIWQSGANGGGIAVSLNFLGIVAAAQGQYRRTARLFGAAEAVTQGTLRPANEPEYYRVFEAVRASLGEEAFAAARTDGLAMTIEQAIVYALQEES